MACGGHTDENWEDNYQEQQDEILALESIFGEKYNFTVLQTPENGETNYELQVSVPVYISEEGITMEVWVPFEDDDNNPQQMAACVPMGKRPQFMRSDSGRRWHSSFLVDHLPPLTLHLTFPKSYPSQRSPQFSLSCLWLDASQLSALCHQLDALWQETQSMPVIFTWVDWLENNVLSFLALEKRVVLRSYKKSDEELFGVVRDPRALPECSDINTDLVNILRYDYEQMMITFVKDKHLCGICFDEKTGIDFYRIPQCSHHFCYECLTSFVEVHVNDGTVQQLRCPDSECKESLPPAIIKDVLGDEAYARWEKLLLQKALDTMGDIVWCPRCMMAVVQEAEETLNLAHCTNCQYSFCTQCEEAWHGGRKCQTTAEILNSLGDEAKKLFQSQIERMEQIAAGFTVSDDDDNNLNPEELEKKLGKGQYQSLKKRLTKIKMEYLNKSAIKKIAKPCPQCKIPIEKFAGCNNVTCSQCGHHMCWKCGIAIRGYDHFDGSCALFPGQEAVDPFVPFHLRNRQEQAEGGRRVQEAIAMGRNLASIMACPQCKQRCLKERSNNHIRCWQCKTNFCFQCKQKITGNFAQHYMMGSTCQQHD